MKEFNSIFNLEEDSLLYRYLQENFNNFTLAGYVDYLANQDDSVALCHVDRNGKRSELRYRDLSMMANKMANYLQNKGIKKGDVIAIILKNNLEFFGLVLAAQKLGAIVMPLQYTNKTSQYEKIFKRVNPACIIAEDYEIKQNDFESSYVLEEINKATDKNIIKSTIYKNSKYASFWNDLLEYKQCSDEFNDVPVKTSDFGYLFSTSGTTGEPKLVMHNYGFALSHYFTGKWYGIEKGQKHLTICDSSWSMASWNMSASILHQGILYVNDYDRFSSDVVLKNIINENIYSLCAPRSILMMLIKASNNRFDLANSNIKSLSSAGEPISNYDREIITRFFGNNLKEGYGMTEVVLPLYQENDGSWVKSKLYHDVGLVKEDGFDEYEIVVYGDRFGLLMGYLDSNKEEISYYKPPIIGDAVVWHTSDIGHLDNNGYIKCDGRFGSTIKSNDCLISLIEVENVIKTHPDVFDCIVDKVIDDISGNALIAYVELNDNAVTLSEDDIKNYVKKNMPNYCRPKYVVFQKIKKTLNGKGIRQSGSYSPSKNMILSRKKHP